VGAWFKPALRAAKSRRFVKELLAEKGVKKLLATYLGASQDCELNSGGGMWEELKAEEENY
jgi:hypothetical protein